MEQSTSSNINSYGNSNGNNKNINLIDDIKQLKSKCYESELEKEGLSSLVESLKSKIRTLQQIKLTRDLTSQKETLSEQIERHKQKINDSDLQLNLIKKELNSLREDNSNYVRNYNKKMF